MKKPAYQLFIEKSLLVLLGISPIAAALNTIMGIIGSIGYTISSILITVVATGYLVLNWLLSKGKIKWVISGGHTMRAKKLSLRTELIFWGIIGILFLHVLYGEFKEGMFAPKKIVYKVFSSHDRYFKLLILPWQKECEVGGKKYDIGLVIKQRLEDMAKKDKIGVHVYYMADSGDFRNYTKDRFHALMKFNNADMVIRGSYSLGACEADGSDKVCYMYQCNLDNVDAEVVDSGDQYAMHNLHGLGEVRDGTGQENIDFIIHWVAALAEWRNNNYPRGAWLLKRIKDYDRNPQVLFALSNFYLAMHDNAAADSMLEKVLQIEPAHEEANVHKCISLLRQGKIAQAKAFAAKRLTFDPRDMNAVRDLCVLYAEFGDTARSNAYARQLVRELSKAESNDKKLGSFYREFGNFQKSREYYEKAFAHCSKHADDWNGLGIAWLKLKDTIKARYYFAGALKIDSNFLSALTYMGMLLNRERKYDKALICLRRAEWIDSTDEVALYELGINYRAMSNRDKGLMYFERALQIDPNDVNVLIEVSVSCMELKQFDSANRYLDRLVGFYPKDTSVLRSVAKLCVAKGNQKQADVYYRRALQLH